MSITVSHESGSGSARAELDGRSAGRLAYSVHGAADAPVWILYSTRVDPDFEGLGVGSQLVRTVLDEARAAGAVVDPSCWFVAGWIRRHPDYEDLVAGRAGQS